MFRRGRLGEESHVPAGFGPVRSGEARKWLVMAGNERQDYEDRLVERLADLLVAEFKRREGDRAVGDVIPFPEHPNHAIDEKIADADRAVELENEVSKIATDLEIERTEFVGDDDDGS